MEHETNCDKCNKTLTDNEPIKINLRGGFKIKCSSCIDEDEKTLQEAERIEREKKLLQATEQVTEQPTEQVVVQKIEAEPLTLENPTTYTEAFETDKSVSLHEHDLTVDKANLKTHLLYLYKVDLPSLKTQEALKVLADFQLKFTTIVKQALSKIE